MPDIYHSFFITFLPYLLWNNNKYFQPFLSRHFARPFAENDQKNRVPLQGAPFLSYRLNTGIKPYCVFTPAICNNPTELISSFPLLYQDPVFGQQPSDR